MNDRDSIHLSNMIYDGSIDVKQAELEKKAYINTIHKLDSSEPAYETLK